MRSHAITALTAFILLSPVAFSEEKAERHNPACKKIAKACTDAGFKVGAHKNNKGLFKDCLQPILEGKAVDGVLANDEDIEVCRAAQVKKK